jgi:hypothetical protein
MGHRRAGRKENDRNEKRNQKGAAENSAGEGTKKTRNVLQLCKGT